MHTLELSDIKPLNHKSRMNQLGKLTSQEFDVLIIGGGINGCCIYHHAKRAGLKVALVEAQDFASQTSQNSGMMIWGGLLYLQNYDFKSVYHFSRSRDNLIDLFPTLIEPKTFHFVRAENSKRNRMLDYLGLQLYWGFSHFKRKKPYSSETWNNQTCLSFEEAILKTSDAHFTLNWLNLLPNNESVCINYLKVCDGHYDATNKIWKIDCLSFFEKENIQVKCKSVINAAGISVDEINALFEIKSPYKHVFSKGVYLNVKNNPKNNNKAYIFEMGSNNDVLTYMPWGNVALWGSTETIIENKNEGYYVTPAEREFLIKKGQALTHGLVCADNVISTRVGMRPLAVSVNQKVDGLYGLDISRQHKISITKNKSWISVYGGKISGCDRVADQTIKLVKKTIKIKTKNVLKFENTKYAQIEWSTFPGIEQKVPTLQWCVDNQYCCTMEDYLRRRTNIAQWIPHLAIEQLCQDLILDSIQSKNHFNFFKERFQYEYRP